MKWKSPYLAEGLWLKGNPHTHTTVSDGGYTLSEIITAYHGSAKYDFVMITDHTNEHGKPEKFVKPESIDGFCIIEGREDSYSCHMLGLGCPMTFHEDEIQKKATDYTDADNQRVVDKIVHQGGLAYAAHPHWKRMDYWGADRIIALDHLTGIEIINGDRFTPVSNLATDVWDEALTAGKVLWGIGADDFHGPRTFFNAWTMVLAKSNTRQDILDALTQGSCYATNGAAFESITIDGDWIIAECGKAPYYAVSEKTFRFIGQGGIPRQIQTGKNGTAAYKASGDEQYIRVELILNSGYSAYSSPFFPEE